MIIEEAVIDYIVDEWEPDNPAVFADMPANTPEQFIIVQRLGVSEENYVRSATIAIQVYSKISLFDAAVGCEWVCEIMQELPDNYENIFSCNLNSSYNFTDTDAKIYRYQAVFEIAYQTNFYIA